MATIVPMYCLDNLRYFLASFCESQKKNHGPVTQLWQVWHWHLDRWEEEMVGLQTIEAWYLDFMAKFRNNNHDLKKKTAVSRKKLWSQRFRHNQETLACCRNQSACQVNTSSPWNPFFATSLDQNSWSKVYRPLLLLWCMYGLGRRHVSHSRDPTNSETFDQRSWREASSSSFRGFHKLQGKKARSCQQKTNHGNEAAYKCTDHHPPPAQNRTFWPKKKSTQTATKTTKCHTSLGAFQAPSDPNSARSPSWTVGALKCVSEKVVCYILQGSCSIHVSADNFCRNACKEYDALSLIVHIYI